MFRRRFLVGLGASLSLAGCIGRQDLGVGLGTPPPSGVRTVNLVDRRTPNRRPRYRLPAAIDPVPAYQGRFTTAGRVLDNVETLDHWRGDVAPATDRCFDGHQSVRLGSTSGRAVAFADYAAAPLDLTDRDLSFAYYPDLPDAQVSFYVELYAPDRPNRLRLRLTYHGNVDLGWQRLDIGPDRVFGEPDLARVTGIRFKLNADRIVTWIDDLRATPKPARGKVVLRFDDTHEHHFTDYFPLLERYGYPGIEAVVLGAVGSEGRLTVDQMQVMQSAGWEMVNHTVGHEDVTTLTPARLRHNLLTVNRWLTDNGFGESTDFFMYPFNRYDGRSLAVVADYFDLAFAGGGLTNVSLTNPLTVASVDAEESIFAALDAIDLAARYRQLLVLMFHTISRDDLRLVLERLHAHRDRLDVVNATQLRDEVARLQAG